MNIFGVRRLVITVRHTMPGLLNEIQMVNEHIIYIWLKQIRNCGKDFYSEIILSNSLQQRNSTIC